MSDLKGTLPGLIAAWAKATSQPMPPDGRHRYSFTNFYDWLKLRHPSYAEFRSGLDPRYEIVTFFDGFFLHEPR